MHLFGDPDFPRRNLWLGAMMLTFSSFLIGMTVNELFSRSASAMDYVNLVIWVAMLFFGSMGFRLGLASVPADPEKSGE